MKSSVVQGRKAFKSKNWVSRRADCIICEESSDERKRQNPKTRDPEPENCIYTIQ